MDAATAVSQPNPLKESVAQGSDNAGQGRGRLKKSGDVLKITKNDKEKAEEGRKGARALARAQTKAGEGQGLFLPGHRQRRGMAMGHGLFLPGHRQTREGHGAGVVLAGYTDPSSTS